MHCVMKHPTNFKRANKAIQLVWIGLAIINTLKLVVMSAKTTLIAIQIVTRPFPPLIHKFKNAIWTVVFTQRIVVEKAKTQPWQFQSITPALLKIHHAIALVQIMTPLALPLEHHFSIVNLKHLLVKFGLHTPLLHNQIALYPHLISNVRTLVWLLKIQVQLSLFMKNAFVVVLTAIGAKVQVAVEEAEVAPPY